MLSIKYGKSDPYGKSKQSKYLKWIIALIFLVPWCETKKALPILEIVAMWQATTRISIQS